MISMFIKKNKKTQKKIQKKIINKITQINNKIIQYKK